MRGAVWCWGVVVGGVWGCAKRTKEGANGRLCNVGKPFQRLRCESLIKPGGGGGGGGGGSGGAGGLEGPSSSCVCWTGDQRRRTRRGAADGGRERQNRVGISNNKTLAVPAESPHRRRRWRSTEIPTLLVRAHARINTSCAAQLEPTHSYALSLDIKHLPVWGGADREGGSVGCTVGKRKRANCFFSSPDDVPCNKWGL